jgi:hypothetical protein
MRMPSADLHTLDSKTETEEFNLVTYYKFQGDKEPSRTPR